MPCAASRPSKTAVTRGPSRAPCPAREHLRIGGLKLDGRHPETRTRPFGCRPIRWLSNQSCGLGRNPNATITASAAMVSSVRERLRRCGGRADPGGRAGLNQLHALDAVGAAISTGCRLKREGDALLLAVLVVAPRAGHVVLVAPIGAGHAARALPDCGAVAIHPGIAAAEHDHFLAAHVDEARAVRGRRPSSRLMFEMRYGSASWTPGRSSPSKPPFTYWYVPMPRNTASNSSVRRANGMSRPISTPSLNSTPMPA